MPAIAMARSAVCARTPRRLRFASVNRAGLRYVAPRLRPLRPATPAQRLRPGDSVAIIAPAGPFDRPTFERGLARIAARYRPVFDEGLFSGGRYLAGDDSRRAAELQAALDREEIRGIFSARGGYGCMRLLGRFSLPASNKPLVGFSDITALHAVLQQAGRISVHAPVVTQLGNVDQAIADELFELLENPDARPRLRGEPLVPGKVEGPVIGGNLSVLTRLIGTPFMPPVDGAILFFEDVGERPYRLDRMWTHLALAGVLDRVAGIAMGTFTGCDEKGADYGYGDVLRELALARGLPSVIELPVGHSLANRPIPLGARAVLDGEAGTLTFLEGAVR